MTIISIGTDIVYIPRIEKIYLKYQTRFINRILHQDEQTIFYKKNNSLNYLAKRYAAKEAIAKALGTGVSKGIRFTDFIILNIDDGQPKVYLVGKAAEFAKGMKINNWCISLSDEKKYALAFVIAQSI